MIKLRAVLVTITMIGVAVALGILSSKFFKPGLVRLGLQYNWAWPLICIGFAILFSRLTATSLSITGGGSRAITIRLLIGILIGVGLQGFFYLIHLRKPFEYQGYEFMALIFQLFVSFAEEMLFRGAFQAYLGRKLGGAKAHQIIASVLVSLPFALIHGLNPVMFGARSFDGSLFIGTLSLSLFAGTAYALTKKVDTAFAVHVGNNLMGTLF